MSQDRIKTAFIGAGNHAAWTLYPTLQYYPQIKLECVCDLDLAKAKEVGRRFGAKKFYDDFHVMLNAESLDALFCCGGPKLHSEVIVAAIEHKIPLFVEKPPADTAGQLKQLSQQAKQRQAIVMVAFMHRFASVTNWARKAQASKQFGKTMMIYAREGCWSMSIDNMVRDSGIHHIDLMRNLAGSEVQWVQAAKCSDGDKRHAIITTMQFANGVLGQLNLNSLESFSEPSDVLEVHGDQGQWLRLDNWAKAAWFRDSGNKFDPFEPWLPSKEPADGSIFFEQPWTTAGTNRSTVMQGYQGEIGHFVGCVEQGCQPVVGLADGYRALQLVEAINQSCQSGSRVFID